MGDLWWFRAEVKRLSAFLCCAILRGNPLVLPQVLYPRFGHKDFKVPLWLSRITKQVPADRTITLTYSLYLFHRLQELICRFRIDPIFNGCDCRTLPGLWINQHDWFRPMHRGRQGQIILTCQISAPSRGEPEEEPNGGERKRGRHSDTRGNEPPDRTSYGETARED